MRIECTDKICHLRAVEPQDLELMYVWENDREVWRVSGNVAPLSRNRLAQFIEEQNYDIYATRQMRLIIEAEGIAVGTLDIFDFDPQHLRFGIGILVYGAEDRRRGYARAAIEAIKRYGRETLGVKQIWAGIAENNPASIALFEACGFERCGTRRAWLRTTDGFIDQHEYQVIF
ncbi:MAG: GNAT family N-acetyltransferase [Alistipes sp.]|nr:GNAT family N-acetyltransferase [Alistipes sp.]